MKGSIVIEQGSVTVVLTPETKFEQGVLGCVMSGTRVDRDLTTDGAWLGGERRMSLRLTISDGIPQS